MQKPSKNHFIFLILTAFGLLITLPAQARDYGLKTGQTAPAFTLPDALGKQHTSKEYLAKGPLVLVFYRGDWCPFCNKHLKEIQAGLKDIQATGATVAAVSVDKPGRGKATSSKNKLVFDVLSDTGAKVLDAYNVRYTVNAETQKQYKKFGVNLGAYSGRTDGVIAVPAVFVIGRDGKIHYAYANEDYKVRAKVSDFLPTLQKLAKGS